MWQKFENVTVTDRPWMWECPSCQAEHEHVEEHDAPSRPSTGSLASSSRFVCVCERDALRVVCVCRRSHGRVCVCVLPLHTFFEAPWLSLVYVLSWDCRDSVAAKVRAPRQERIRAAHRQQQAVAAQAREARHGGGTSFPMVDNHMLVYDDSDDEGHDDDSDVDESRSTGSTSATAIRPVIDILIHYFFSPFPRVHLAVWHGAIERLLDHVLGIGG